MLKCYEKCNAVHIKTSFLTFYYLSYFIWDFERQEMEEGVLLFDFYNDITYELQH